MRQAEITVGTARDLSTDDETRVLIAAREHAEQAHIEARNGYLQAAIAHDRAAKVLEAKVGRGQENAAEHRTQAVEHRRCADADRRRAAEMAVPTESANHSG